LAKLAFKLHKSNIQAVFSNSDTPDVRKLYDGLQIIPINVPRRINSNGSGRGNSPELLIVTGM
jgi:site-specific DNA-adenine methylase